MALVTGSANVSIDAASAMFAPQIAGLYAGEALKAAAPCYIKSDGEIYECVGPTGSSASAAPFGFTPRSYLENEPVTLYGEGTIFEYKDSGLTPGAVLFINKTVAGYLDSAATMCDAKGVAVAIDARRIRVTRANAKGEGQ